MSSPTLTIDLDKIEHNARTLVRLCQTHGIQVTGVTKCVCGNPEVARAMLRGGVAGIADSRLPNIYRLHAAGVEAVGMLLRLPALSAVEEVVAAVQVSLNSELSVLRALSAAAVRRGLVHEVVLMLDLGDLREGVWVDDFIPLAREASALPGIRIKGVGGNLACFGGVVPSADNMRVLVEQAEAVEALLGARLDWISGINSSGLELIAAGGMPARVNHARIGEAILLGRETVRRRAWPDTFQDAFVLRAEMLELQHKPSVPVGERSEDAFGERHDFEDRGVRLRALLNVGREDVDVHGIVPLDARIRVLGATSGYLVLDVTDAASSVRVGDELAFSLSYGALLAAMTSEYVQKCMLRSSGGGADAGDG
jgi:predicted amino acid racemase